MQRSCSAITQLHRTFPSPIYSLAPQTLVLLSTAALQYAAKHKLQSTWLSVISVRAQRSTVPVGSQLSTVSIGWKDQGRYSKVIRQRGRFAGTFRDESRSPVTPSRIVTSALLSWNYLSGGWKTTVMLQEICTLPHISVMQILEILIYFCFWTPICSCFWVSRAYPGSPRRYSGIHISITPERRLCGMFGR